MPFNSNFSKITAGAQDVQHSLEKLNMETFSDVAQLERHPSTITVESIDTSKSNKRKVEMGKGSKCVNMKGEEQKPGSKNAVREEGSSFIGRIDVQSDCEQSTYDNAGVSTELFNETVHDHDCIVMGTTIWDHDRFTSTLSLPTLPSDVSHSERKRDLSTFYHRVKRRFVERFTGRNDLTKANIDDRHITITNSNSSSSSSSSSSSKGNNSDDTTHFCKTTGGLYRGVTILGGKSFYLRDGVYIDDEDSEYQMSCPKTIQSIAFGKRSEIEELIAPETSTIPIRKDSPFHLLESLKRLSASVSAKVVDGDSVRDNADIVAGISTDPVVRVIRRNPTCSDAGSSSLNFSNTERGSEMDNETSGESFDHTEESQIGSHRNSNSNSNNIIDSNIGSQGEIEPSSYSESLDVVTTTLNLGRTATRTTTIAPGSDYAVPTSISQSCRHSITSCNSCSSTSSSTCSLLKSPAHLLKSASSC